jgi:hypothetical protein
MFPFSRPPTVKNSFRSADARLEAFESNQESIGSQESGGVRSLKEAIVPSYGQ